MTYSIGHMLKYDIDRVKNIRSYGIIHFKMIIRK